MEELIKIKLKALGKPMVDTGYPYVLTTCLNPNHEDKKPSFSLNLETGFGRCFSCNYQVSSKFWVNDEMDEEQIEEILRTSKYKQLTDKLRKEEEEAPEIFMPPHDAEVESGWRGLNKNTIETLELYICRTGHYANRVIFPMRNRYGNISAFNTRALDDGTPKYKYSKGIKVDELIYPPLSTYEVGNINYIHVVEGIMDAISMWQDGIPTFFNFGVNNTIGSKKIGELLKAGVETIYFALDNDEAGLKGLQKYLESDLSNYFELKLGAESPYLQEYYKSGCKDYNDYIQER